VPLLRGEDFPMHRDVLVQYFSDTVFPRIRKMGYAALRTERWKYIQYSEQSGADELYDLQADPYELKNLAADSTSTATLKEMTKKLATAVDAAR
jgi:arylsulfatase A-like enzyme